MYCDAPVAPRALRAGAALLDGLIVAIGAAAVLAILFFKAGEIPMTRQALLFYGLVYAGLLGLYRLMSCVLAVHSPGTEWMGLRLLHFDGRAADLRLRLLRLASSLLSLLPAGAGLLWALADEERLTWHDHISKTFVTTR